MSHPTVPAGAGAATVPRAAQFAAILGGMLWALVAPVFVLWNQARQAGAAAQALAVIAAFLVGVVSLLLLLCGLVPLYRQDLSALGQAGRAGVVISAFALGLMALGNGAELITVTARGHESDLAHTVFLGAFLVLLVASILIGEVFVRRRWGAAARLGGLILLLALPLGILLLLLGNVVSPTTDLGFWAALTMPYGIGRVLLALSI